MSIDLGRKLENYPDPCPPATSSKERVIYPSLYIEGGPELEGIPPEGVIKIRYKAVRASCLTRDGKTKYELDLEAHEILGTEGADSTPKKSRDQELDELAKRVSSGDDEDSESE